MKAEIISIGDELLIGQVINTNAAYLGKTLGSIGISVEKVTTIGDDRKAILKAFRTAWRDFDVVIVTGGLGPTHDDISKDVVSQFFKKPLQLDKKVLAQVRKRFAAFGYKKMPESNLGQAMVPKGFTVLKNEAGTAPGLLYHEKKKTFVILPGVPHEMEWITEHGLLTKLRSLHKSGLQVIRHRTLLTAGIGESALAELIGDTKEFLDKYTTLAFLPRSSGVRLRITGKGEKAATVTKNVARVERRIRNRAAKYLFGSETETLQERIVQLLKEQSLTLATAESCTGGMISEFITSIPGSSEVFIGSVVSYANSVKHDLLGVTNKTLEKYGAVSEQTAKEMAEGVRSSLQTHFALSVTGIAGPTGGTEEKPVGTVWIALAEEGKPTFAKHFRYLGDRTIIRERSANSALEMLRKRLVGLSD